MSGWPLNELTLDQVALLDWMVESAQDPYIILYEHGSDGPTLVGSKSGNLDVSEADFSELVATGLVRDSGKGRYAVTNLGREIYDELHKPPPEPPQIGFAPTG
jgi:hypothetical protein